MAKNPPNDPLKENDFFSGGRFSKADVPDLTDVYEIAYQTIERLPPQFRPYTKSLIIRVENYPDDEMLESVSLVDRNDLLGLYKGIPLPQKGYKIPMALPDVIFLFRCPLIRHALENEQELVKLIEHVMIHEIAHHFGFEDGDLEWIENGGRNRD
jgi:predicted Zn-dependent protease with MMP-like domain